MKILIVEDHPKIRENISKYFKIKGFISESCYDGKTGLEKAFLNKYDLIILDINLPIMNGVEFLKLFRKKDNKTPIIALTSNNTLEDKIEVFDLGADDYLTKPFELKELELRINALLKRNNNVIEEFISKDDICINFTTHKIFKDKIEINLKTKEFLILEFLLKNKGYPKSKNEILQNVWGEAESRLELSSTTLESHISTIRKKLGKNLIKTLKGVGYIIE